MAREKVLILLLVVQLVFVFTAFGLAVALTAKEHAWYRSMDTVDPAVVSYISVPDLTNYNLFACIFGIASLLTLILTLSLELVTVSVFLIAQVFNFIIFLASFIQFATSDLTKANCTGLSGHGDLYTSFCALPKACEALDAICWILFLAGIGFAGTKAGSKTSEPAEMAEASQPSQKTDG